MIFTRRNRLPPLRVGGERRGFPLGRKLRSSYDMGSKQFLSCWIPDVSTGYALPFLDEFLVYPHALEKLQYALFVALVKPRIPPAIVKPQPSWRQQKALPTRNEYKSTCARALSAHFCC